MQTQTITESEVHRQHVRLKAPIQVDLDGVRYEVDDWSIGGFAVESAMTSRLPDERFAVRVVFPFEAFEMSMRVDVRMVYVDPEHGRFGCAFLGLSTDQMAMLRYVVEAYLAGEMVSAGDLLQAKGAGAAGRRPASLDAFEDPDRHGQPGPALRRHAGLAISGLVATVLLAFVTFQLWAGPFANRAETGVVDGPLREIRAPEDGRFLALVDGNDTVQIGDVLGTIHPPDGPVVALDSPCDCVVVEQFAGGGGLLRAGDPVAALIDAGATMLVRAELPLAEVRELAVGGRAAIEVVGRPETMRGEIVEIDLRPRLAALRRGGGGLSLSERRAQVLVRPDRPLAVEDYGVLVSLRFL